MHTESVVTIDRQGRVVLPKAMRRKGQRYFSCLHEQDGTVHLVPIVGVITPRQAYFWTKRWQKGEHQASQDIRKGKHKTIPPSQLDAYLRKF